MAVTDWRAWIAQQGGAQPGQTSPFAFPGIGPLTDSVSGVTSLPATPSLVFPNTTNVPQYIKPSDPFQGWTAQLERNTATAVPTPNPLVQITNITTLSGTGPASGVPAGGTAATINGYGFTGATAVNFGATPGTAFVVVSNYQITVTSPAGTTKTTVPVTIVNATNGNTVLYNAWSYT